MDQQQLHILAQKYLEGTATPAEEAALHQWYDSVNAELPLPEDGDAVRSRMQQAISQRIRPRKNLLVRWTAAAAAAAALLTGTYFIWRPSAQQQQQVQGSPYKEDAEPGTDKALLTLADGKVIELDSARNGTLGLQGKTLIRKDAAVLSYKDLTGDEEAVRFNTLSTPRGGQYRIVLPDGTAVWINAASSLHFPTAFKGAKREVNLKGEAYFEVAKDVQHPFIVTLENGLKVEVLGTHFNIKAYTDEKVIQTSLLEGAVRVQGITLKPGQQSRHRHETVNEELPAPAQVVQLPYIEDEIAWKQGMFIFNGEPLEDVMRQLSRWYNLDIHYTSEKIKTREFTGQISRKEPLSEVLQMLELTGAVHFQVENGKITAAP